MNTIANTLQIPTKFTQIALPMPLDTLANHKTKWSKLTYPPSPTIQILDTPPITNLEQCLPLKHPTQFYYYTNGSYKPAKNKNSRTRGVTNGILETM